MRTSRRAKCIAAKRYWQNIVSDLLKRPRKYPKAVKEFNIPTTTGVEERFVRMALKYSKSTKSLLQNGHVSAVKKKRTSTQQLSLEYGNVVVILFPSTLGSIIFTFDGYDDETKRYMSIQVHGTALLENLVRRHSHSVEELFSVLTLESDGSLEREVEANAIERMFIYLGIPLGLFLLFWCNVM